MATPSSPPWAPLTAAQIQSQLLKMDPQYRTEDGGVPNLPIYIPRLKFRAPEENDGKSACRANLLLPEPVFKDPQIKGPVENWPAHVRIAFATAKSGYNPPNVQRPQLESTFYGAWNSLLQHLFPSTEHYVVKPQGYSYQSAADFMASYQICYRDIPLGTIDIEPPQTLDYASLRKKADKHIRDRMYDISSAHHSNKRNGFTAPGTIYGLSVFGAYMSFYVASAELHSICFPLPITQDLIDLPPSVWWRNDVCSASGRYLLRKFVRDIQAEVAKLIPAMPDPSQEQLLDLIDPDANKLESNYGIVRLNLTWKTEPKPVSREQTPV
ncbi:hypothetical protein C8R44DRAFT_896167 [Mycena epipterygia]|nr:hypothetical protein C8R44DRAFT_896167 [Mycena epipterygia]